MAYDPQYYKQYYKQHKKKILADKEARYKSDPKYREAILRRARVSSVVKTLAHQKQRAAARILHNGTPEKMYYVVHMEKMVDRDRSVLDAWRKSNPPIIPQPLYFDKRGRGVYSESQIQFIAKTLYRLDRGSLSMTYNDLRRLLHSVWNLSFSEKALTTKIREALHGDHSEEIQDQARTVRKGKHAASK